MDRIAAAQLQRSQHAYLWSELDRLDLMLHRQVLRLRARHQLVENEYRGMYIPDEQIDALLQEHRSPNGDPSVGELTRKIAARQLHPSPGASTSPLSRIGQLFGLIPTEADLLLIALAPAIDLRYETFYAYVQNDVSKKQPTLDLACQLLFDDPDQRLASQRYLDPDAPLLRNFLLALVPDPQEPAPAPLAHYLRIDPRIVAYMLGSEELDPRLRPFTRKIIADSPLTNLQLAKPLLERLAYTAKFLAERPAVVFLSGPPGVGKRAIAGAVSHQLGLRMLAVDLRLALLGPLPFAETLGLLHRESILQPASIYLDGHQALAESPAHQTILLHALSKSPWPVFISGEGDPIGIWPDIPCFHYLVPMPDYHQRLSIWGAELAAHKVHPAVDLTVLANKFSLSRGAIRQAAQYAAGLAATRSEAVRAITDRDLHAAARVRSNQALVELAQKIEPKYRWDDLVLPRHNLEQLREVYLSVRYRHVVYAEWGFERKLSLGKGVNALFYGPSGTGKTMAAEILANELSMDAYKIDLSTVVSKYIGETEKNLDRIFTAAESSNAILFFDEADALFGKRSEVKDARDRYANIEVAYLLQKMEEYAGITILATNLRGNMDDAFARRLHHSVEFPFPDADLRERIWRAVFPSETPRNPDIDYGFLARQFELSGGNIRNVALTAAFLAADAGSPVTMELLVLGVARELHKMDKLPTKAAFREFYPRLREMGS